MSALTKVIATLDVFLFLGILAVLLCLLGAALCVWLTRRAKDPLNHWSFYILSPIGGVVIFWILVGVFRLAMHSIW